MKRSSKKYNLKIKKLRKRIDRVIKQNKHYKIAHILKQMF